MKTAFAHLLIVLSATFLLCACGSEGGDGDPCEQANCGGHGSCNPDTGTCQCDPGYTGLHCEPCHDGYHMEGGVCVQDESLEIVGNYTDDWGFTHAITSSTWDMSGSLFNISQFDNDLDFLVAQNDSANEYSPDLWSRFDWVFDGNDLYYCQIVFEAASEQDAQESTSADSTDLAAGCGGFGWSQLN